MKAIPPFNRAAVCPKCRHDGVTTRYCAGGDFSWHCEVRMPGEHLHRRCSRCHYLWVQRCLDQEPGGLSLSSEEDGQYITRMVAQSEEESNHED